MQNAKKDKINKIRDIDSIQINIASPEQILSWSHGEVVKAETINYRTGQPVRDGLFCEVIFGPKKSFQCSCGKYKGQKYAEKKVCEKCGVALTKSDVRRSWFGHINLCVPVCHIWYLKTKPKLLELILNLPTLALEQVIYYNAYIITTINQEVKEKVAENLEKEYKNELKQADPDKKSDVTASYKQTLKELANLAPKKILNEKEFYYFSRKYPELFEAETGADPILKFLREVDLEKEKELVEKQIKKVPKAKLPKLLKRLKYIKAFISSNTKPENLFLTVLPVIPPDLRPMVQLDGERHASSDSNDLYRRVITRNNRLSKMIEAGTPSVIIKNEKRMLQEAVDSLLDNSLKKGKQVMQKSQQRAIKSLSDNIKGKTGRFRHNLLGKRVDFSGRSVIVIGPELKEDQCGLPKEIALEMFKPFIIHELIKTEQAYSIQSANKIIEERSSEVWAILEKIVQNKWVLLNRAPTLHKLSIQAFKPILIEGSAIQLYPFACTGFNADFDGDQMSVHLPLSKDAQEESEKLMASHLGLLKPADGKAIMTPSQDIALGCFWLTYDKYQKEPTKSFTNSNEVLLALENKKIDLWTNINLRLNKELIKTTPGRVIFNNILPEDFPFQNETFKKKNSKNLINTLIDKYGFKKSSVLLNEIKNLGFNYATKSGISLSLNDFVELQEKNDLIAKNIKYNEKVIEQYEEGLLSKEEKVSKICEETISTVQKIENLLETTDELNNSLGLLVRSGARGSFGQLNQMVGVKGIVAKTTGERVELPIFSNYKNGFNVSEYFNAIHGARKGLVDTALKTAESGYLTRKLVDVSQDTIIRMKDCGDKDGIEIKRFSNRDLNQDFKDKIASRYLAKTIKVNNKTLFKKNILITKEIAKQIEDNKDIDSVRVFSPLSCKCPNGICQKCYGADLSTWKPVKLGQTVGILAAQSIGENSTQLTLSNFHTGGVASSSDITMGLPYVEGVFQCRTYDKKEAILSEFDAKVKTVNKLADQSHLIVLEIQTKAKNPKYKKYIKKQTQSQYLEKGQNYEYKVPADKSVLVKENDIIQRGDKLTTGPVNTKDYYKLAGLEKAQQYIKEEIQQIFLLATIDIHEKHFEIIINKMFSQVKITKCGDSNFVLGEVISIKRFVEENYRLRKENKKPAKAQRLLSSIKKVALNSDSFLSAASFEQTSFALIKSAAEGKIDDLSGLKSNIIVGRLIPAGTGFKHQRYDEEID